MNSLWPMLTSEYLAKLSSIRINITDRINTGYNGERKSNARGNSLEFSDFRDYAPGDDSSRIDWNSFGRLGRLYTKLFEEEKQAFINFFIDTSSSMDFGGDLEKGFNDDSSNKLYFAKLFTASAAYISLRNSDKINVMTLDKPGREQYAGASFPELVGFLDDLKAGGEKRINTDIKLNAGASIIISDFMLPDGYQNQVKLLQSKKQEVIFVHVLSQGELDVDMPGGALRLTDSETGAFREIEMSQTLVESYRASLSGFLTEIREFCSRRGIRYVFAPSDSNMLKLILSFCSSV